MGPNGTDVKSAPQLATAVVLGVPVDDVTVEEAVDVVDQLIERSRAGGTTHQVATVNAVNIARQLKTCLDSLSN